ncbi:hypothetical protein [[Mycobacterium] vasticus]|uniref:Uncharacterized protein n=1 Tax=[Mycobacterium] vasticus TaxID=2875777 RepID=A0ABU5Z3T8_9MYCO|nr:hypothetical protein [Mycolicibacter sp. MYC017]MEB3072048.1 hypothetical protein [Mycolicibacter sp. MYC017]
MYAAQAAQTTDDDTRAMARAGLLLPVLWQARIGRPDSWWRAQLATALATDCQVVREAAVQLLDDDLQPWETGGPQALTAWYIETRDLTDRVVGHIADRSRLLVAAGWLTPRDRARWETLLLAGHRATVLADASYLAAGGDPAVPWPTGSLPPGEQLRLTAADRAVIDAPRPDAWTVPPPIDDPVRLAAARITEAGCIWGGGR